ncbi:MAG: von Willebrand factor type A domain-containing protein [Deltaproteobacteria bacterium]|nr:von Willebrand factor type A domain-containing protein [Deltaproteobacteria bacterium]
MLRRRPRLTTALALVCSAAVVNCAGAGKPTSEAIPSTSSAAPADAEFDAPDATAPAGGTTSDAKRSDDGDETAEETVTATTTPVVTEAPPEPANPARPTEPPVVMNRKPISSPMTEVSGGGTVDVYDRSKLDEAKEGAKQRAIESAKEKAKDESSTKSLVSRDPPPPPVTPPVTTPTPKPMTLVKIEKNSIVIKEPPKEMPKADPKKAEETASTGGTFVHAGTNPFIETVTDALSTFAIDVDTGSFTFARRFLRQGQLPPDAAIRVEEWVNAMHYSYEGPTKASPFPFSVLVQGAPSPIAKNTHLVRVALQGKRVSKAERGPTSIVFLADVSGSMDAADKLPLARDAMHLLIDELRDDDSVAIATYAGETRLALSSTMIKGNKKKIHAAIDTLSSAGGTNMGSGMELAYREAQKGLGGGRSARVVVLSDGDVNIGRLSHQDILKAVRGYVSEGVMMSTVGFGTGNYNDNLMEQLADAGNGNYSYIDSQKTAERVFVHELDGTLETIAQDVKIQVEWNKDVVTKYRLVGYENRDVADKDFRNDKKDAGEIGAGHAVTALYELELSSSSPAANLGTVRIRAKKPRGTKAEEMAVAITASNLRERPNDLDHDAQTAVATALAAEILRGSPYAEGRTLGEAASLLREAAIGPHAAERLELARELMLVEPRVARR